VLEATLLNIKKRGSLAKYAQK
jgi:hypothetical protein